MRRDPTHRLEVLSADDAVVRLQGELGEQPRRAHEGNIATPERLEQIVVELAQFALHLGVELDEPVPVSELAAELAVIERWVGTLRNRWEDSAVHEFCRSMQDKPGARARVWTFLGRADVKDICLFKRTMLTRGEALMVWAMARELGENMKQEAGR